MEKNYKVNAQSERNGIIFHSKTCPLVGIATFRDESGEIQRIIVPIQLVNYMNYLVTLCEKKKSHSKHRALIFDVLLITICLLSGKMGFVFMAVCFSLLVSFNLFTFIEMSYEMKSKKGSKQSIARYHAAEHMVINCYEKLKRIPTFEEVKKASRFSKDCGNRVIIHKIVMGSLFSLSLLFFSTQWIIIYFLLCILIAIFGIFADEKGWLRFLQVFVTAKPSDEDIDLAIEGIKNYEMMEEWLNDKNSIEFDLTGLFM